MNIDKRSIDEVINSTIPLKKYEYIVQDFLRDKKYDWKLNYYDNNNNNHTTYDVIIARTNVENENYMKSIKENKLLIDRTRDTIEKNNKVVKKNGIQELNKKLEGVIEEAIDEINELNILIKNNIKLIKNYEWFQYIELNQDRNLRIIRNKFKMDDNLEYLRRGVTWICSYSNKLRGFSDEDEKEKEDESLTAW